MEGIKGGREGRKELRKERNQEVVKVGRNQGRN
jgi:hypothetical protein